MCVCRRWRKLLSDWELWRKINIKNEQHLCSNIRDETVASWILGTHIIELYLDNCYWLTDQAICYIGELCPNLHTLSLKGCAQVNDPGVAQLSNNCFKLRKIDFYLTRVSDRGFNLLVDSNPAIEKFRLPTQANCKRMLEAISRKCTSVTELILQDSINESPRLDDNTLRQFIEKFPMLRKLHLTWCCHITDRTLQSVAANCRTLQSLRIKECPMISDDGIRSIAERCRLVEDLHLERQSLVNNSCCYAIRDHLHHITSLGLIDTCVTDVGIEAIATNGDNLRTLCFGENCFRPQNIKGACLPTIIQHCSRLEKLHMYSVTMDDDTFLRLSRNLAELRDLHLGACYLVSKEGLKELIDRCKKLVKLSLYNCPSFRDGHIDIMAKRMTQLHYLEIIGCSEISEEGVRKFTELRPNCLVKE